MNKQYDSEKKLMELSELILEYMAVQKTVVQHPHEWTMTMYLATRRKLELHAKEHLEILKTNYFLKNLN